MQIDLTGLSQSELLQVVNATPLGVVLTRPRLRRQMDAGALRFGDGQHIHLVRYVRWLIGELERPRPAKVDYAEARRRQAERNRAATKASQDIYPVPEIENWQRRCECGQSFRRFCEVYFPVAFHRAWSDDHLRVIGKIERAVREGGLFAFAMPRGSGKALALDTPLPTPTGWTTMGEIQVGDVLFNERGHQCRVILATDVMHGRPCYRVSFSDGEAIVCDADHLWTVHDRYSRRNPLTLRTADMVGRTRIGNRPDRREHRYVIPMARPIQTLGDTLPIPPFVLGLWLGNGTASNACITNHAGDEREFTHLIGSSGEALDARPGYGRGLARTGLLSRRGATAALQPPMQSRLRALGLLGNKHIPPLYLRAGPSDRLALLQGLMDTDGSIAPGGRCELTLKEGPLARDVAELLASLGIKFGVGEKWVWLNGRRMGPYRRFGFSASMEMPVFRLARKRSVLPACFRSPAPRRRFITAIVPVPSVPVRCIQVDSPSQLYLAGRKMVPTHNTTLARCAALWAVLYGYRPFVCLIAGSQDNARELLSPIKKHTLENPLLLADFAEAIHPLKSLENSSKRQLQQHCRGQLTHVHWGQDKLVFPTIEGDNLPAVLREAEVESSPSCGSIITTTSLDSHLRGQQHSRVDGSIIRPSLVLLDDPQTRESARSSDQTRKRLELLHGDVMGMAGPGETISALCTCTVTYENDLADTLLDREKSPDWDSERTKLVISWPTEEKMWERYAEIRRSDGARAATAFYAANRAKMDAGAVVAWPARVDTKAGELSAIQNAMNLKLRVREQFDAEYQNEPTLPQVSDQVLTIDQVIEKANAYRRGDVPPAATKLTMFIDVHDKVLFYAVCAWEENFTGYVVDYGTFPDQRRSIFTLADATRTLGRKYPHTGIDGAIHAGLEQLVSTYLAKEWNRGGALMKIDRLFVDMGYKPGIVADVKRRVGGAITWLAKGVGIRASRKPIAEYAKKPGETIGHYWYVPNVRRTGQFAHVLVDVNYWKRFIHDGLGTSAGDRGCISIFGKDGRAHELLAEHIARSEKWVEVTGPGGVVREWSPWPTRPDNHWFDCLVGCAAAASMCGVKATGEVVPVRGRKRYSQDDLRRRP